MARYIFQGVYQDGNGRRITEGTCSVYLAGTTTAASAYTASSGGSAVNSVTTDEDDGSFVFYVDTSDYDTSQTFKIILSKTNFISKTVDNIVIFPTIFASNAEAVTGTETLKAVTPANLTGKTASDAETLTGTSKTKFTTPANLAAKVTAITASSDETQVGTSTSKFVTPAGLRSVLGAAYFPDYSETDQGVAGSGGTVNTYVDAISSNSATIVFRNNSGSATTTYTFSTSETIPSNISVFVEQGAIISVASTKTLTINGSLDAGLYQIFTGSGSVTFGASSIPYLYPEWWGIDGTTDETEIGKAITAAANVKCVKLQATTYTFTTAGITNSTDDMRIACDGGIATITTAADIDAITLSGRTVLENIKAISTNASPTKAGVKLTDGMKLGRIQNCRLNNFLYPIELSSSTATGVAYNTIQDCYFDAYTNGSEIYIHESGSGWVNENLFLGNSVNSSDSTHKVYITGDCNQNKFFGNSFEGNDAWQFAIYDAGYNIYIGNRFEVSGYGFYINNSTSTWATTAMIYDNYWSCKQPYYVVVGGRAHITNVGTLVGGIISADRVSTTVNSDSAAGQKVLKIAATDNFYCGDAVLVNASGDREEWCHVASIQAGTSLTMTNNLRYAHTAVQADDVVAKGRKYGMNYRDYNLFDFYTHGVLVFQIDNTGAAKLKGALSASTDPTP